MAERSERDPSNRYVGSLRGDGLRIAIACGRFNDLITDRLLAGAVDGLTRHGGRGVGVGIGRARSVTGARKAQKADLVHGDGSSRRIRILLRPERFAKGGPVYVGN